MNTQEQEPREGENIPDWLDRSSQKQQPNGDEVYQKNIEDWWDSYDQEVKKVHPDWSDKQVQAHLDSIRDDNKLWEFYDAWLQVHLKFTEEQASQKIEEAKQDITLKDHATTLYVSKKILALEEPSESSQ